MTAINIEYEKLATWKMAAHYTFNIFIVDVEEFYFFLGSIVRAARDDSSAIAIPFKCLQQRSNSRREEERENRIDKSRTSEPECV